MLGKLTSTVVEVESAYDEYQFYRANQALVSFANTDLSGKAISCYTLSFTYSTHL